MKIKFPDLLTITLSLLLLLLGIKATAQNNTTNDAKIYGKLVYVSSDNNALIVKLQARAIHNTDPNKILMLTNSTLWVRFNDSIVSFAETPRPATSPALNDGDYYYPGFLSPNYVEKRFNRQITSDNIKDTSQYIISHVVWEGWLDDNWPGNVVPDQDADVVNEWTDVAYIRLNIKVTGQVQLKWGIGFFNDEILDEDLMSYEIDEDSFEGLKQQVTYIAPVLQLSSSGVGINTDPYIVNIKSTNTSSWNAGTSGFHIYYNSDDATYVSSAKLLSSAPFSWGTGTVTVKTISQATGGALTAVSKEGHVYDRVITYISNDGNQNNDNWPVNSSSGINALSVIFKYNAATMWTYLETIDNEELFKNYNETIPYTSIVTNPTREMGFVPPSESPLPVTLMSFNATLADKKVSIKWSTASELNNDKFVVERSRDGRNFEAVTEIKGRGNSNTYQAYAATDLNPLSGTSYYRLKQIDWNGDFAYSGIETVVNGKDFVKAGIVNAYPNPVADQVTLVYNAATAGKTTVSVLNNVGKIVKALEVDAVQGSNSFMLNGLSNLSAGIYIVKVYGGVENSTFKLIKK